MRELSTKPYLIRAIYEWCVDSGATPYVQVMVDERTRVPQEHVKDGQIVLNIGPEATRNLKIGNEAIQFSARFSGVSRELSIPVDAVAAIFARENGQGIVFQRIGDADAQDGKADAAQAGTDPSASVAGPRSHLQVVK